MADLLLELFSEEIPARMQARAEADLLEAVVAGLKDAGIVGKTAFAMSGPRRLAVVVEGLPERSADVEEERKGPKVGAPEKAIEGFMRGAGLSSIEDAEVRSDPKKGDFYVAVRKIAGRDTSEIIAELVPEIVKGFHWPKSMRWGTGDLRWVRPLQRIVCVLGGEVVAFEVGGVSSGSETEGHRVMGRGPFTVTGVADYRDQLGGPGHVRLTREERRELIATEAARVCGEAGLELVEDKGLLEEVTGLAEWPVVILGDMDPAFLELPPEVIRLSMRTHQKYFAVRDPKSGELAPKFVVVANIDPADGGKQIAAGNAKVLSARLEDARFFYANDIDTGLEAMGEKLGTIQFKEELGSIADKVERVAALGRELAPAVGADPDLAERAARLMKNDLVSEMVYEFPELQGVMGRYYALEAGEDAAIADAIRDHYKPQGPSDDVPSDPVAIAVALADKLDTLYGFWKIDEKPTSSKDPYALRRAALGVYRIETENDLRLNLRHFFEWLSGEVWKEEYPEVAETIDHLQWFLGERMSIAIRELGGRYDYVEASRSVEDSVHSGIIHTRIAKRVEALGQFLDTEDGENLLAGYKRAANILRAEEKKDALPDDLSVDAGLVAKGPAEEQALHAALGAVTASLETHLEAEDFTAAMGELAKLRAPVDAFFEGVMVNDEDAKIRANRLGLLDTIRSTVHRVADFSLIEGG